MNVIIAYDGSECADGAIQDLRRAGLPANTSAFVLSVAELLVDVGALPPEGEAGGGGSTSTIVRQARKLAREAITEAGETAGAGAARVTSLFPTWRVEHGAVADSPHAAVVARAEQWPADLVVVGSHGRSALGRLVLGSVSQKVITFAPCSVSVGRSGETLTAPIPLSDEPPRLMLAVDGSSDSALAVEAVRVRPWPRGTEVKVVTSVDLKLLSSLALAGVDLEPAARDDDAASFVHRRLQSVCNELAAAGLQASPAVLDGDPKQSLVRAAERWAIDCIFLGAKGQGRLARFLLGSVSSAVAARAHCSVEVVRSH
jgi:nucleotide-binding universal stress UspA family protein